MEFLEFLREYATLVVGIPSFVLVFFGYTQLKHMKSTRDSEFFLKTFEIWNSDALIESRKCILEEYETHGDQLCQKVLEYEKKDLARYFKMVKVGDFFEALGCLVEKKFLDSKIIKEFYRGAIINYYKIYKPWIVDCRKEQEKIYKNFEMLAKKN